MSVIARKYTSYKYGQFEKMLDDWFGTDRNGDKGNYSITDYNDPRICKYSLAGVCPFTILKNTRYEKHPCRCEVCPCPTPLREQYLREKVGPTTYDQQLYELLDSILASADKHIIFSKQIRDSKASELADNPELKQKDKEIKDLLERSRKAGLDGNVEQSFKLLRDAELLREQRKNKEYELQKRGEEKELRIVVCEVCTAVIKQSDLPGRMDEHVRGRQHIAYKKMREVFENLKSAGVVSKRNVGKFQRKEKSFATTRKLVPLE